MGSNDFFPLWEAWTDKLMRTNAPHFIPIDELPGYDGGSENFKQALWEFEEDGFVTVDYFSGVKLTRARGSLFYGKYIT